MAKKSTAASPHSLTLDIALILESTNPESASGTSGGRAEYLLKTTPHVLRLAEEEQTRFLNNIDQGCPTLNSQNSKILSAFGVVCSAVKRLPTSAVVSEIEICDDVPYASVASTDMWQGKLGSTQVSISALRFQSTKSAEGAKEILWKRVPVWTRLSHDNVLPFRGVEMDRFRLALVYDCAENGGISQHIASHPHVSRKSLLLDAAMGLKYLHQLDVPHGDLKAINVVIDKNGRARLAGYGLAPINLDPSFTVLATRESLESSRWLAPEIMKPPRRSNIMNMRESKPADVFAFGMLAMEIFTGQIPFVEQENATEVVFQILRGDRPKMPKNAREVGLTVEIWNLIESCWRQDPKRRPTIEEIVARLQELVNKTKDNVGVSKETQPVAEPAAVAGRRQISGDIWFRKILMAIQPRRRSEAVHPGAIAEVFQQGTRSLKDHQGAEPGIFRSDAQPNATAIAPRKWFCGLV